ncbi:MAG: BTAD domain-containing putative transcriptional regulator, partial [Acidimicrobiales bacterium]
MDYNPARIRRTEGMMRIGVLGPLEVRVGSMSRALGSEKQRLLLAALTVHAGSVVSTDRLVEILWGEAPPPSALRGLRTYIYRLRTTLEDTEPGQELIVTRPPGYLLDPGAVEVIDAWRHEALLKAAIDPVRAASSRLPLLDEALALWRGPAYAEFCDQEFARGEALRLEESRRVAADARCEALIDLGQHADAIAELDAIVDRHPHRQRSRELLMRALYRSGRHAEALEVANHLRNLLRDELGLDPPPAIASLEVDILRQAPELTAPAPQQVEASPGAQKPSLPAETTRLVGREAPVRSLAESLENASIVSVVGPGGVGKTRVALAVAREREASGPGAVWWCELAPLQEGRDVAHVLASALQVRPDERVSVAEAVVAHLRHRTGLLVLDNCEHLSVE